MVVVIRMITRIVMTAMIVADWHDGSH
jgi:hypothetical protein